MAASNKSEKKPELIIENSLYLIAHIQGTCSFNLETAVQGLIIIMDNIPIKKYQKMHMILEPTYLVV